MNSLEILSQAAKAQEECVRIMRECSTPTEIRNGFLKVAEIMSKIPGQEMLVSTHRRLALPGEADDDMLFSLRENLINEFSKQSRFLRESVGSLPTLTGNSSGGVNARAVAGGVVFVLLIILAVVFFKC
ncbi:MAG: hypothetical protein MOB07_28075 [Acidobacteria bacterium]|nr:hypothetical protein [Acidobacteriota bacterium]